MIFSMKIRLKTLFYINFLKNSAFLNNFRKKMPEIPDAHIFKTQCLILNKIIQIITFSKKNSAKHPFKIIFFSKIDYF